MSVHIQLSANTVRVLFVFEFWFWHTHTHNLDRISQKATTNTKNTRATNEMNTHNR